MENILIHQIVKETLAIYHFDMKVNPFDVRIKTYDVFFTQDGASKILGGICVNLINPSIS